MNKFKLPMACAGLSLLFPVAYSQSIPFTQTVKTINYPAQTVIQGDINHDGYPDFLFGLNNSLNIYTYISDGRGDYIDWSIPTQYCPAVPLALGDFQRNSNQDMLAGPLDGTHCATYSPTFSDYVNNGSGTFSRYKSITTPYGAPEAVVVADFNGDKKLDAVVIDGQFNLELYYGNGYGSFSGAYKIATLTGYAASLTAPFYNLIAGDFDGNGCTDVAWTEYEEVGHGFNSQLKVAYGDCKGSFSTVTQLNLTGEIDNLQTADLNRDGISDIVSTLDAAGQGVVNPTLQILYGQKNRTLSKKLIADPTLSGPIQAADLNGDGYQDITYISYAAGAQTVKTLVGDASQQFTASSTTVLSGSHLPQQFVSGDYNRDGKTDLALLAGVPGSANTAELIMLENNGPYPGGRCVTPAGTGFDVCSPTAGGIYEGSKVAVLASANTPNPTVYMELWVDGVKRLGYGSTHELRGTVSLTPGTHQFTFYAIDGAGNKTSTSVKVTNQ